MTKTQLVKWLENQNQKAIEAVEEKHKEVLENYKSNLHEQLGLKELANAVQTLLNQADDLMQSWKDKHSNQEGIYFLNGWGTLHNSIYDFISSPNSTFNKIISSEFRCETNELEELRSKTKKVKTEINVNYSRVISNIKTMKDAKSGVQYLKELGFNLSELIEADEKPVSKALTVEVDKRFLFIGGER